MECAQHVRQQQDNWKIFQFRIQQVKTVNCFLLFLKKKSILNLPGTDSLIDTTVLQTLYYRVCIRRY